MDLIFNFLTWYKKVGFAYSCYSCFEFEFSKNGVFSIVNFELSIENFRGFLVRIYCVDNMRDKLKFFLEINAGMRECGIRN